MTLHSMGYAYIEVDHNDIVKVVTVSCPAGFYSIDYTIAGGPAGDGSESTVSVTVSQPNYCDQRYLPMPYQREIQMAEAFDILSCAANGGLTKLQASEED